MQSTGGLPRAGPVLRRTLGGSDTPKTSSGRHRRLRCLVWTRRVQCRRCRPIAVRIDFSFPLRRWRIRVSIADDRCRCARRRCVVGTRIVGQAEDTHADGDKRYGRRAQHDRRARTTGRDERTHIRGRLRRRHTRADTLARKHTHTHTGASQHFSTRGERILRRERSATTVTITII